jgi:hypothetical protein
MVIKAFLCFVHKHAWGCHVEQPTRVWGCHVEQPTRVWGCHVEQPTRVWGCHVEQPTRVLGCHVEQPTRVLGCHVEQPTRVLRCHVEQPTRVLGCHVEQPTRVLRCHVEQPTSMENGDGKVERIEQDLRRISRECWENLPRIFGQLCVHYGAQLLFYCTKKCTWVAPAMHQNVSKIHKRVFRCGADRATSM